MSLYRPGLTPEEQKTEAMSDAARRNQRILDELAEKMKRVAGDVANTGLSSETNSGEKNYIASNGFPTFRPYLLGQKDRDEELRKEIEDKIASEANEAEKEESTPKSYLRPYTPSVLEQAGGIVFNGMVSFGTGVFSALENIYDATVMATGSVVVAGADIYSGITGENVEEFKNGVKSRVAGMIEADYASEAKAEEYMYNTTAKKASLWAPEWADEESQAMGVVEGVGKIATTFAASTFVGPIAAGAITGFGEGTQTGLQIDTELNDGKHSNDYFEKALEYGTGTAAINAARYWATGKAGGLAPTNNQAINAASRIGTKAGIAGLEVPAHAALDSLVFDIEFNDAFEMEGGTGAMVTDIASAAVYASAEEVLAAYNAKKEARKAGWKESDGNATTEIIDDQSDIGNSPTEIIEDEEFIDFDNDAPTTDFIGEDPNGIGESTTKVIDEQPSQIEVLEMSEPTTEILDAPPAMERTPAPIDDFSEFHEFDDSTMDALKEEWMEKTFKNDPKGLRKYRRQIKKDNLNKIK